MGQINLNVKSRAPVDIVYDIAHQTYDFVDALPNIRRIRKLEVSKDRTYSKTEWVLDFPLPKILGEISWIKDAHWEDNEHKCKFILNRNSKGIVKYINGQWYFKECPDGTEMRMNVDLTVKHFLIGTYTRMTIDKILENNLESLLKAISAEAEKRYVA
jgi:hypothetical protein